MRSKENMATLAAAAASSIVIVVVAAACDVTGACVGSGGSILLADVCQNDYTADECEENNTIELDDATWVHHPGASCESLGYTEECANAPGTFRTPGSC